MLARLELWCCYDTKRTLQWIYASAAYRCWRCFKWQERTWPSGSFSSLVLLFSLAEVSLRMSWSSELVLMIALAWSELLLHWCGLCCCCYCTVRCSLLCHLFRCCVTALAWCPELVCWSYRYAALLCFVAIYLLSDVWGLNLPTTGNFDGCILLLNCPCSTMSGLPCIA